MKLEKVNETVWSVKRKKNLGEFILRSIERDGSILKVMISLVENGEKVTFEMKYPEFNNFFNIFSNFKDLIENPEHLARNESIMEEIPILDAKISSSNVSSPKQVKIKDIANSLKESVKIEQTSDEDGWEKWEEPTLPVNDKNVGKTSETINDEPEFDFDAISANLDKVSLELQKDMNPAAKKNQNPENLSIPKINIPLKSNKKVSEPKIPSKSETKMDYYDPKKKLQEKDWDPW
ncbi:MAG: hypothetical protein ACTSUI_03055 [Promethearchaeota archaeon]